MQRPLALDRRLSHAHPLTIRRLPSPSGILATPASVPLPSYPVRPAHNSLTIFDAGDTLIPTSGVLELSAIAAAERSKSKRLAVRGCCAPVLPPRISESQAAEYASWFKALADPTRIRILNLLAQHEEPVCVCDIVEHFPLGQPTISHHLKILRDARFVFAERRGTFMYYRVNRACLAEFPEAARRILGLESSPINEAATCRTTS